MLRRYFFEQQDSLDRRRRYPTGAGRPAGTGRHPRFRQKLVQPGAQEALEHYVRWQVAMRNATDADAIDLDPSKVPDFAPISINLDLTTACNYACDHCVDLDILNTGIRFDHDKLLESIKVMAERDMKSVIVIGGGEPTLYPKFEEVIRFKEPESTNCHCFQRHWQ